MQYYLEDNGSIFRYLKKTKVILNWRKIKHFNFKKEKMLVVTSLANKLWKKNRYLDFEVLYLSFNIIYITPHLCL